MASLKLQDQSHLCQRAQVQTQKMTEALTQMQAHKSETDKLLASYNSRFSECQESIEKSNEVSFCYAAVYMAALLVVSNPCSAPQSPLLHEHQLQHASRHTASCSSWLYRAAMESFWELLPWCSCPTALYFDAGLPDVASGW